MIITSHYEGVRALTKALGIEKNCMGFTLICKPDNIVRLHVTYALQEEQAIRMVDVFKKYRMEEVTDAQELEEV